MAAEPLVSVIITTYNCAEYIQQTIQSVIDQTYKNLQIIVVDDGSDDETSKIVKIYAVKDARLKFFQLDHSGSPAHVRNAGIKYSQGKYIALLDGDDIWAVNKIELQVGKLEQKPDCVLAYSMSVTFGNVKYFSPSFEVLPLLNKAAHNRNDMIYKGNVITNSSVLIRSDILKFIGGFDEDPQLKVEDYDLWIRLGEKGDYCFIPKILVHYRIHGNQFSGSWEVKKANLKYLAEKRKLPLPEYKFYRNKGMIYRIIRNSVHMLNYFLSR